MIYFFDRQRDFVQSAVALITEHFQKKSLCSRHLYLYKQNNSYTVNLPKPALHRMEGNLLLREGITLVAHFKELNAYTKTQEVSKILTFVNKIMYNNNELTALFEKRNAYF